ncbi:MAG: hypothetical protein K6E20_02330 [Acholeplasmatales bacterium]|nr:hypothetical protein [Acholeplasmatales bacterium]
MENILNLKSYNKYKQLFEDGLIVIPDDKLTDAIKEVENAYIEKPIMRLNETHEVTLKAGKKVRITSRGSLRDIEIDGVTYDKYIDVYNDIRFHYLDYTFLPILDPKYDNIRYTISKYSKTLRKYFDPHKVVKAVYSIDNILFYVKDDKNILRKYYFRIGSFNIRDLMPAICKQISQMNGINSNFYIAFFIHEEELPFTVGATKEDFYALKDILNKISFKGTTPIKYMVFDELKRTNPKHLKTKEAITFNYAMELMDEIKEELCDSLNIDISDYDNMMENEIPEIEDQDGNKVDRHLIAKHLNIVDNILELKYY